jgi:hypothetical protein
VEHEVNETRKAATTSELSCQRGNMTVTFTVDNVNSVAP